MRYYAAFYQAIKERILDANPNEKIAICSNSQIYDNDDFELLSGGNSQNLPDSVQERLKLREDLAYQFNSMSSRPDVWDINVANNLFKKYRHFLDIASITTDSEKMDDLDTHLSVLFNDQGKETEIYKKYKSYLSKYDQVINELEIHVSIWNESNTDEVKKVWSDKYEILRTKLNGINAEWIAKGNRLKIDQINELINKQNEFTRFKHTVNQIKSDISLKENTGLESMESFIALQFIPFNFGSDNTKWSKIRLDKSELDKFEIKFTLENPSFGMELDGAEIYEQDTSYIEAEYCIVNINRNWLRKDIINSKFIKNNSTYSFYPERLMFIRNVSIELNPAFVLQNVDVKNSFIKFGPYLLKNQLFSIEASKITSLQTVTVKDVYKSINFTKLNQLTNQKANVESEQLASNLKTKNLASKDFSFLGKSPGKGILSNKFIKTYKLSELITAASSTKGLLILNVNNKKNLSLSISNVNVSIIGINSYILMDLVSDSNGELRTYLPIGNYEITLIKDGYKKLEFTQNIENTNNLIVDKSMDPDNISYNSTFLIGVCLEQISL